MLANQLLAHLGNLRRSKVLVHNIERDASGGDTHLDASHVPNFVVFDKKRVQAELKIGLDVSFLGVQPSPVFSQVKFLAFRVDASIRLQGRKSLKIEIEPFRVLELLGEAIAIECQRRACELDEVFVEDVLVELDIVRSDAGYFSNGCLKNLEYDESCRRAHRLDFALDRCVELLVEVVVKDQVDPVGERLNLLVEAVEVDQADARNRLERDFTGEKNVL